MRLPALFLALFATLALFAADEPKTTDAPKGDTPAAKPAEKAAPKAKKTMPTPEIPEGISIEDGVKLQNAWNKAQTDDAYKAAIAKAKEGDDKPKGEAEGKKGKKGSAPMTRGERGAADEALTKAMLKADPSLKPELVRTYLESAHRKGGERTKKKAK
jgi:hypothetical protein